MWWLRSERDGRERGWHGCCWLGHLVTSYPTGQRADGYESFFFFFFCSRSHSFLSGSLARAERGLTERAWDDRVAAALAPCQRKLVRERHTTALGFLCYPNVFAVAAALAYLALVESCIGCVVAAAFACKQDFLARCGDGGIAQARILAVFWNTASLACLSIWSFLRFFLSDIVSFLGTLARSFFFFFFFGYSSPPSDCAPSVAPLDTPKIH